MASISTAVITMIVVKRAVVNVGFILCFYTNLQVFAGMRKLTRLAALRPICLSLRLDLKK